MRIRVLSALVVATFAVLTCDKATPVAPAEATLTISANPTRIERPDGVSEIKVIARKSDGNAVNRGTEINFSTTFGALDSSLVATDDRGIAETMLRGQGTVGTATVTASSGAAAEVALDIQIGALPASITLNANPASVPKDPPIDEEGQQEVDVSLVARVSDDLGNRLNGAAVTFTTPLGLLASGSVPILTGPDGDPEFPDGVARDTLTLTKDDIAEIVDFLSVEAETVDGTGGVIFDSSDITVRGLAANISLSTSDSSIPVDGGTLILSALVLKTGGGPAVNEGVQFSSEVGSLASGGGLQFTNGSGQASDTLTVSAANLGAFVGTSFNVTARVSGSAGELLEDIQTVDIQGNPAVAAFTASISGATATFTSTTTGAASATDPIKLNWDFGDGTIATQDQVGASAVIAHTYTTFTVGPGMMESFTVTLTASNPFNTEPSVATLLVTVTAP